MWYIHTIRNSNRFLMLPFLWTNSTDHEDWSGETETSLYISFLLLAPLSFVLFFFLEEILFAIKWLHEKYLLKVRYGSQILRQFMNIAQPCPHLKCLLKKKKKEKEKKKSIEFDVIAGKQRKNHKPPKTKEKISLG